MFDYTNEEIKKYIDVNDGLNRVRNNKKLYTKMLKMLLACEEFNKLKTAVAAEDYDNAEKITHSIKGITGNLSLSALFETSIDLMKQFKSGYADEHTIGDFWNIFEITIDYVKKVIEVLEEN